jgi:hypothetical protein
MGIYVMVVMGMQHAFISVKLEKLAAMVFVVHHTQYAIMVGACVVVIAIGYGVVL